MDVAGSGALKPQAVADANGLVDADQAWRLVLALRQHRDDAAEASADGRWGFRQGRSGWVPAADDAADVLIEPARCMVLRRRREFDAQARAVLDLHLKHALRGRAEGVVVAMLGQSLDGFIATMSGQSQYINGPESLVHLHRVRALSDAVIVGVGTALADDPQLTTRHVAGPNATRVVLDPRGRLPLCSGLLSDGAAPTLVVRAATDQAAAERRLTDQAYELSLPARNGSIAPGVVIGALAMRGLTRLLVEGGGITVARFLEAGLLDRLQLAVSPVILGSGRPALPVAPALRLDQALRPTCRSHRLGDDTLFDLRFARAEGDDASQREVC